VGEHQRDSEGGQSSVLRRSMTCWNSTRSTGCWSTYAAASIRRCSALAAPFDDTEDVDVPVRCRIRHDLLDALAPPAGRFEATRFATGELASLAWNWEGCMVIGGFGTGRRRRWIRAKKVL
jgi:hypothetical protein